MGKRALHTYFVVVMGWVESDDRRIITQCHAVKYDITQPNENIARHDAVTRFKSESSWASFVKVVSCDRYQQ